MVFLSVAIGHAYLLPTVKCMIWRACAANVAEIRREKADCVVSHVSTIDIIV